MTYRVYSGPRGAEGLTPSERARALYKEFGLLDDALGWARRLQEHGRSVLLIEGDDGTEISRNEIAATLRHAEAESERAEPVAAGSPSSKGPGVH